MTRKKKLFLNTSLSIAHKAISVICAFILPRLILSHFGSDVNGLAESIANFLGFISMLEMGVTSVIDANLYKPLAEKDYEKVNDIFVSSKRFFRRIAYIFIVYVVVLSIIYPFVVQNSFDQLFTATLILIIAISTFSQYYFGISYRILINADQRGYFVTIIQAATIIVNTIISAVLIRLDAPIHVVKLSVSVVFLIQPLFFYLFAKKKYHLNVKKKIYGEPIKQKWNGFAQHLAFIVSTKTDIIVLTLFSSLQNVSIYGIYALVLGGLTTVFDSLYVGVSPLIGNMLAKNETENLEKTFTAYEWLSHYSTTLLFTMCAVLIVPFVKIYTRDIADAGSYALPLFGVLLTIAFAFQVLRTPYKTVIHAAGHFKQTQNSAIIEMVLNISVSIIAVFNFGLVGVAIGTIVSMLYRTLYFVWYLSKNILKRPIIYFIRSIVVDLISIGIIALPTLFFKCDCSNYFEWIVYSLLLGLWGIVSTTLINLIFNGKTVRNTINLFKHKHS